jgi:hypothetical protein
LPLDHEHDAHGGSLPVRRYGNERLVRIADVVEPLDPAAEAVQGAFASVLQPIRDVLDGVWLGNPLHPAVTDVPLAAKDD